MELMVRPRRASARAASAVGLLTVLVTALRALSRRPSARALTLGARRSSAPFVFGVALLTWVALDDGGYALRASLPFTVGLAAVALLAMLLGAAISPGAKIVTSSLVGLAAWAAASSLWAVPGSAVGPDVRRDVLYALAFAAAAALASRDRRRPLLVGLTIGIGIVGVTAMSIRATSGPVIDRYYGTLLSDPVGYPNALGVLAAMGTVLGLGLWATASRRSAQGLVGLFVLVLGLSGSRGGALALVVGLVCLISLAPAGRPRCRLGSSTAAGVGVGVAGWLACSTFDLEGWRLAVATSSVVALGACIPEVARRPGKGLPIAAAALGLAALVAGLVVTRASTTTSFRADYWRTTLVGLRDRPFTGAGSGSFHVTWRNEHPKALAVRDAHSLYLEAIGELGPVGLALVLVVAGTPVLVAVRRRGDELTATAGAAFVVVAGHASVDWDWEMPAVMLAALACAAVVLQTQPPGRRGRAEQRRDVHA